MLLGRWLPVWTSSEALWALSRLSCSTSEQHLLSSLGKHGVDLHMPEGSFPLGRGMQMEAKEPKGLKIPVMLCRKVFWSGGSTPCSWASSSLVLALPHSNQCNAQQPPRPSRGRKGIVHGAQGG